MNTYLCSSLSYPNLAAPAKYSKCRSSIPLARQTWRPFAKFVLAPPHLARTFKKVHVEECRFEHNFDKVSAEARKHILQIVAMFCSGRGIELRHLLHLAEMARLGYDREERK